jgi:hypothetical protein
MARTYREEKTYLTREESDKLRHKGVRYARKEREKFRAMLCDTRRGDPTKNDHARN